MTPTEAYEFAMESVYDLKKKGGIKVTIVPSKSKQNQETVSKYNLIDRIPPELWIHITFKFETNEERIKIFEMGSYLGLCGISFDTGGCCNSRDWEFDWSFKYKEGDENWDKRNAREDLEDTILGNMTLKEPEDDNLVI